MCVSLSSAYRPSIHPLFAAEIMRSRSFANIRPQLDLRRRAIFPPLSRKKKGRVGHLAGALENSKRIGKDNDDDDDDENMSVMTTRVEAMRRRDRHQKASRFSLSLLCSPFSFLCFQVRSLNIPLGITHKNHGSDRRLRTIGARFDFHSIL